ncbi:DUF2089 domain-containing protein [Bacillus horti]|uniref:DUF2089 domain-containing protein n=1 Tax=Caldalkalibacillus horti TaxID=77523 RepID=A0ABT9W6G0_9BACI|nr:DUF2089 domain-containing protein [Bacillus horti]MDQ0168435.1 hypothetical protein [Bacillus horti]
MKHRIPQQCPVCESRLVVQELKCDSCKTTISGRFETSRLGSLTEEQLKFVEIFIKVRGSIKEMERELNISYPTVRNRLEQVIEALGYEQEYTPGEKSELKQEILNQLNRGEISSEEALKRINQI